MLRRILPRLPQLRPGQVLRRRSTDLLELQVKLQALQQHIRRDLVDPAQRDDLGEGELLLAVLAA